MSGDHSKKQYVVGAVQTNTIEGLAKPPTTDSKASGGTTAITRSSPPPITFVFIELFLAYKRLPTNLPTNRSRIISAASFVFALNAAGIGHTKLYQAIGANELRAVKHGKRTLILARDLQVWLNNFPPIKDS
jgi:hypothetical protein